MRYSGMGRPVTTRFILMSVDRKTSPGVTDDLGFDKHLLPSV